MEILLLVAIIAVGASALYVAITFNKRTRRNSAPLIDNAVKGISDKIEASGREIEASGRDLRRQLQVITDELQQEKELINQDRSKTQERFDHADMRISSIANQFSAELDTIKRQGGQIGTRQDQFSGDLRQFDHYVAQLGESLARLSAQVEGIESYIKSQETQTIADIKRIEAFLQGIGADQSKIHGELASIVGTFDRLVEINTQREDYGRWAAEQMMDTIRQIEGILRNQSIIESYLHVGLEYEVMRTTHDHKCRIVPASLRLDGSGADLLWPLLLSFCETVMFKAVLPESQPRADSRWYLLWQSFGGLQLEEVLSAKLAACQDSPASPSQGQVDGLEELRSLAIALHIGGPGTIQVGPMIINRTPRALLGCVVTAAEAMHICNAGSLMSPDTCEAALRELTQGRITELTSWADSVAL